MTIERCFPPATELYSEARGFASKQLGRPQDEGGFRRPAWDHLAAFDLFRMPFRGELGGLGLSATQICDVLEGLGAGSADTSTLFAAGAHLWAVMRPLVDFGTDEQLERHLPALMEGTTIGAHAASEPAAGSDVMGMQTRYEKRGDRFVLNGSKMWVTNAPVADLFVLFATSDPRLHFRGVTAFLAPRDTPGLTVGPAEAKMGLTGAPLAEVFLDDCELPASALLGKERRGAEIFRTSLHWERTLIQGTQVGSMRRQIEASVTHAVERKQFGQPIGKFQAVAHRIVDMWVAYWQARLVLRLAAEQLEQGGPAAFASLSKLVLAESSVATHLAGLRNFGGMGYMREQGIEGDLRDALGGTIYSGTSDLQRNIIADELGL